MLTRNDLSQIKTTVRETIQPEIKGLGMVIKSLKKSMATKQEMKKLESNTKTLEVSLKSNMNNLEKKLIDRIDDAEMEIIATVDKHKADKEGIKVLKERVDRLEDNAGLPPYSNQ